LFVKKIGAFFVNALGFTRYCLDTPYEYRSWVAFREAGGGRTRRDASTSLYGFTSHSPIRLRKKRAPRDRRATFRNALLSRRVPFFLIRSLEIRVERKRKREKERERERERTVRRLFGFSDFVRRRSRRLAKSLDVAKWQIPSSTGLD